MGLLNLETGWLSEKSFRGDEKMAAAWHLKKLFVDVRETVRDRGRRLAASSGGIIDVGDFRIDLSGRTATLRGRELELNAAEFEVLVFLASDWLLPAPCWPPVGPDRRCSRPNFFGRSSR